MSEWKMTDEQENVVALAMQNASLDLSPRETPEVLLRGLARAGMAEAVRRGIVVPCDLREQSGSHPNDAIKAREPIKHEEWCKCECGAQGGESL